MFQTTKTTTTIILTSTVNVQNKTFLYQTNALERLDCYILAIRQWLAKTQFNIVLVENSGYPFIELTKELNDYQDRFEIISFIESTVAPDLNGNLSKGVSELFAIHYALRLSYILRNNTRFVIKVTSRYFIPDLEEYLKDYDLEDYDVLTQSSPACCEMVGCHMKNVGEFFNPHPTNQYGQYEGHIETVYKFRGEQFSKVLHCKTFPIATTVRGGFPKNEPISFI